MSYIKRSERAPFALPYLLTLLPFLTRKVSQADRGQILVHAKYFEGVKRGVLVVESLWPNKSYIGGIGVNSLTGADPVAPVGGVAFHDNAVWIKAHDG